MAVDIPNYRVVEKLGEGAQTRLYRARCMRTGKDYTIKIIKVKAPEDASFVDLLRAEHAIGSTMDHPVIRKVYELRITRQRLRVRGAILFMEYVAGVAMSDKGFQKSLGEILELFCQAAGGLRAMHLAGWVHADLKPNNILVTSDDRVKLIDLGQSSRMREAKTRVQGTIDYIAPEQVQRGVLDQRTDVFGLGAALHRVVTGKPVATEMNQTVSIHSQGLIGKRVADIRHEAKTELPTCVARLIDDCCQNDPADRLPDMGALLDRLHMARTILTRQAAQEASGLNVDEDYEDGEHDDNISDDDSVSIEPSLGELGPAGDADDSVDLDV